MLIRQAAFAKKGTFLKGNLHCHTTLSDGKGTPAAVIRQYENAGYDFLAITDHQRYNFTNYEEGSDLLILPGIEEDRFLDGVGMPVLHIVGVGPVEGNGYTDGQPVHYQRGGSACQCQDIIDHVRAAGLQRANQRREGHRNDFELEAEHLGERLDDVDIQAFIAALLSLGDGLEVHEVRAQRDGKLPALQRLGLGKSGACTEHHERAKRNSNQFLHRYRPPAV